MTTIEIGTTEMWTIILLMSTQLSAQVEQRATINLADGTYINNAQSGRDWSDIIPTGFDLYDYKDTVIIDDSRQDQMTYYGNWVISKKDTIGADADGGCNCSFSRIANDSLVVKFTGTDRFEWWGEKCPHHGEADIYLNGVYQRTVDTYADPCISPRLNWYIEGLDPIQIYTFKLIVTGEKNEAATGAYVVNQFFRLISLPETPPPDPCIPDTVFIEKTDTVFLQPKYYFLPDSIEFETWQ